MQEASPQAQATEPSLPRLTRLRRWGSSTVKRQLREWTWPRAWSLRYPIEWLFIVLVAYLYSSAALLDFDPRQLQQTGEHNESATLPLLAEIGLRRYGEIPLWNPYMLTGFPHAGDLISHFWHPVSTLPVVLWGGINGVKVSAFLAFGLAGIGQWLFAHAFGLRGFVRLWTGLLFMISGGLALLWRVGWYELLLGMAWFPWCFASLWWALHRDDRASLALTALCIGMVLTAGGGYYPFYLLVSLSILTGLALLWSRPAERWPKLRRATAIAALSAGLVAVMLLPLLDGYPLTVRAAGQDRIQRFSQSIPYALINYVVSQPEWFRTEILGSASGSNWFYIGSMPVLAVLALTPLAFSYSRRRRPALLTMAALTVLLLAWHANQSTWFRYIYEWIPFLYNLRFPNRLLVLAASPLLVLAGMGLQFLSTVSRLWHGSFLSLPRKGERQTTEVLSLSGAIRLALAFLLLLSLLNVYGVNKGFAFAPRPLNTKALTALTWLKNYDPALYYTNIGGGAIYWDWTPAAYLLEMPIINFEYGRHLKSADSQHQPESPFIAGAKYQISKPDQPRPENAQLLQDFEGVGLWRLPDSLPFAFSAPRGMLQPYSKLPREEATALSVILDGPNRVVVTGAPPRPGDQLVVLVSDYPGWRLWVDRTPSSLLPANGYLGAAMSSGQHTYVFAFMPPKHYLGLGISLLTLLAILSLLAGDARRWVTARRAVSGSWKAA